MPYNLCELLTRRSGPNRSRDEDTTHLMHDTRLSSVIFLQTSYTSSRPLEEESLILQNVIHTMTITDDPEIVVGSIGDDNGDDGAPAL